MLKLKLQPFSHLIWRTDFLEKTLMLAGGEGDNKGWDDWMASQNWWAWVWTSSRSWWWSGSLMSCKEWGRKESYMTERLNWTECQRGKWESKLKSFHFVLYRYFCSWMSYIKHVLLLLLLLSHTKFKWKMKSNKHMTEHHYLLVIQEMQNKTTMR